MSDGTSRSPNRNRRTTEIAHDWVREVIGPGDVAIDATAGNGHDTAFLARCVGRGGTVYAIDIQADAIASTRARLQAEGTIARCHLLCKNHAEMPSLIPGELHGKIAAIMFNLGYLPGGDHGRITLPATTRQALAAARDLLAPGGILCALAYPDHPGGDVEAAVVDAFFTAAAAEGGGQLCIHPGPGERLRGPQAYALMAHQ